MANNKFLGGSQAFATWGVRAVNPPNLIQEERDPLQNIGAGNPLDFNVPIGTLWLNKSTTDVFMLVRKVVNSPTNKVATWLQFNAAAGPGIDTILDNAANPVVPTVGGDVTIIGDNAAGLSTIMTGANELTITTTTGSPFMATLTGNTGGAQTADGAQNIDVVGNLANGVTVAGGVPGANSLEIQSRGGNRFIELLSGSFNPGVLVTGTAAQGLVELESVSPGLTITGDAGNNKILFTLTGGGGMGGIDLQDNAGVNATPDGASVIKLQGLNATGFLTVSQIDQTGGVDLNAMVVTSANGLFLFSGLLDNAAVTTVQDAAGEMALVGRTASNLSTFSNTDAAGNPTANSMSIGLVSGNTIVEGLIPDAGPNSPVVANAAGNITVTGGQLINTDGPAADTLRINLDQGLDGQVIIGATGSASAYANITSLGGTIIVTNGPNSINLEAVGGGGAGVDTVTGNTGGAIAPLAGNLGFVGNLANGVTVAGGVPGANSLEIQSRGGNRFIELIADDAAMSVTGTAATGQVTLAGSVDLMGTLYFDATVNPNEVTLRSSTDEPVCLGLFTVGDGMSVTPNAAGFVRLIEGANMTITGNPGANSVTFTAAGGGGGGIATLSGSSGGTNPVGPDGFGDIQLTAGANITITGNSAGNEIIFNVTGGGGAGGAQAFCAHRTGNVANVTGMDVVYTVPFNTVDFDDFGTYAPGTGIFTAPVDGKYIFSAKVLLDNLLLGGPPVFVTSDITFLSSAGNSQTKTGFNIDQNGSDTYVFDNTAIMELTAGDTVRVQVTIGNNFTNQTVGLVGSAVSTIFCGALLASTGNTIITKFIANGTWNKNPNAQMVRVMAVGGGAGGGSGRRAASGTGGNGGTGGGMMHFVAPAEFFGASEPVTVGGGGAGGAGVAAGDGNIGAVGIQSSVGLYSTPGSTAGAGGSINPTAFGTGVSTDGIVGIQGSIRAGQGLLGASTSGAAVFRLGVPSGGGGGAGLAGGGNAGGAGGVISAFDQVTFILAGGASGAPGLAGGNGNDGWDNFGGNYFAGATGGGGGGSNAGNGGNGGIPGGGGGGGAASTVGTSGAGGNGGRGEVWIIEYL